jgi:hypothetical protein
MTFIEADDIHVAVQWNGFNMDGIRKFLSAHTPVDTTVRVELEAYPCTIRIVVADMKRTLHVGDMVIAADTPGGIDITTMDSCMFFTVYPTAHLQTCAESL